MLGKTVRTGGRTAATRGASAACLLGEQGAERREGKGAHALEVEEEG